VLSREEKASGELLNQSSTRRLRRCSEKSVEEREAGGGGIDER